MRPFIAIFVMRFKLHLQYRAAVIAGVFTQLFFGFVMVMVYSAFFESGGDAMPMTLSQTITYVWLGQCLLALLPWNGDREVQAMVRSGDVAYELARPLDLYNFWYFRILAQRVAQTSLRMVILGVIVIFMMPKAYQMALPSSAGNFVAFVVTMIGAIFLGCAISNIMTIGTLFTIGNGLDRMVPAAVTLCSGLVIPLAFFPEWSQWLFRILPFSGLTDSPYRLYMGLYEMNQIGFVIVHQWVWTLIIVAFGKWLVQKASSRIVVQGG